LATDRGAILTIRAATRGIIDFSRARLLDPDWWRRCTILLGGVATEDDLEVFRNVYRFHLALVANSGLTDESFRTAQDNARDIFHDLVRMLRPWEKSKLEVKQEEIDSYREQYKAAFGFDPMDKEEEQRRLDAWAEAIKKAQEETADDTERIRLSMAAQQERLAELKRQVAQQRFLQGR
jgi:hypothetical protein